MSSPPSAPCPPAAADPQQQSRMWRELARQCREHGDWRMATEADALASLYERRGLREVPHAA